MEAKLTNSEMETIAKMVADRLHSRFLADGSQKELQLACEKYTKQLIEFYVSDNAVSHDVEKQISPILDKHLKKTRIVEDKLSQYMNTKHFKQIELSQLEHRVAQIKRELYEEES